MHQVGNAPTRKGHRAMGRLQRYAAAFFGACLATGVATSALAADPAFHKWLDGLYPQAQALGVSRTTFDAATRGVEPDLTLPDLDLPGREGAPPRGQAEFVQTPADYIKEANIARMAERGRKLYTQYHDVFARIEKEFGVPGPIV